MHQNKEKLAFAIDLAFSLIVIGLLTMTCAAAEIYGTSGLMLAEIELANAGNLAIGGLALSRNVSLPIAAEIH